MPHIVYIAAGLTVLFIVFTCIRAKQIFGREIKQKEGKQILACFYLYLELNCKTAVKRDFDVFCEIVLKVCVSKLYL